MRLRIRSVLRVVMRTIYFLTGWSMKHATPGSEGDDAGSTRRGPVRAQPDRRAAPGQPAHGGAGLAVRALDRSARSCCGSRTSTRGRVRPGLAEQQVRRPGRSGTGLRRRRVVQSQRAAAYAAALAALADRTYECFCTRREIAEAASAPHGSAGRYPGTCRDLTAAERAERRRTRIPALRLRADGAEQTIHDLLHGEVTGPVDDIVRAAQRRGRGVQPGRRGRRRRRRRRPGRPRRRPAAVGGEPGLPGRAARPSGCPRYAHVPLAVNPEGRRLAKRDGAVTLADLAALGVLPAQVLAPDRRVARPAGRRSAGRSAAPLRPSPPPASRGSFSGNRSQTTA